MASFGKLTEYFSLRKSRPELRSRRWGRRSGSCCCSVVECRGGSGVKQEKGYPPPVQGLAHSGVLEEVVTHDHTASTWMCVLVTPADLETPSSTSREAWRLEDDCTDPPRDPQLGTAVEDAPFSYFRTRSFYMRKSLSVDNHLGALSYAVHPAETKAERVKTKLRRQFVKAVIAVGLAMVSDLVTPAEKNRLVLVGKGILRALQRSLEQKVWRELAVMVTVATCLLPRPFLASVSIQALPSGIVPVNPKVQTLGDILFISLLESTGTGCLERMWSLPHLDTILCHVLWDDPT
ncbi:hypothetical protein BTVI_29804 [Pitangus sulphuratus]|nr:hypothetical protein BTVI_29804 [Pitangus sulphuratus]